MKRTKQYILDKTLALFNEKGFVNVRLQHIAHNAVVGVKYLDNFSKIKMTSYNNIRLQFIFSSKSTRVWIN